MSETIKSFQDYKLIETSVNKFISDYGEKYKFTEPSIGFLFFILEKMFNLQEDEAYNAITDTIFITRQNNYKKSDFPHDKGIDSILIDEEDKTVHLMNFKYYQSGYEKIKNKKFESGEIPKIKSILKDIFEKNIPDNANPILKEKLREIFILQDKGIRFKFKIYFISNIYSEFTEDEESEFKNSLKIDYNDDVKYEYLLIQNIVAKLTEKQEKLNAKFKINGKNFFEKSEYGHRALIVEMYAKDLIRIILNDDELRNNIETEDSELKECSINENAFEDNVRVYLKQRSNINKNIKNTALDEDESDKFFFYNNGVTITCENFEYQGKNNALVSLFGIQVVNGSQTIHSLKEAFDENEDNFDDISLLCRIYETKNSEFKSKIAEYTNNQNPVNNRDVRSIDIIQIKLEKELNIKGYFYERKRSQYENESKELRIDSEKFGQAFLSFYLEMPAEAKNKKSVIFSTKYNEIFNDNLTSDIVLEVFKLYKDIEDKKLQLKGVKTFLAHSTYYIMYFIYLLNRISNKNILIDHYDKAVEKIEYIREKEKEKLSDDFSDGVLFRGNNPKKYLSELGL
jgi:hypothetical protein